ncbi:MAG: ABC transporter ATP-binding protein [Bdellovibrionales bacterium]|nr:ABC transporter ATP-binding protein [Bdellovibrionales bacterium]
MLLEVRDLAVSISIRGVWHQAIEDISFSVQPSETLGIVGESGSGKSLTALSLLKLLPKANSRVDSGEVKIEGIDVLSLSSAQLKSIRGKLMSIVFQDSASSLNPVLSVGSQLVEALTLHTWMRFQDAKKRCIEMMNEVGISSPTIRFDQYPHELSGGMKQRIALAMALLSGPNLLIADEPTTALDVTIQAQILSLLKSLKAKNNMAMILISHDLGLIFDHVDQVLVMYGGQIVEKGSVSDISLNPCHPYTMALKEIIHLPTHESQLKRLKTIQGNVPSIEDFKPWCRFVDRCSIATSECKKEMPPLRAISENHMVRCIHA